MLNFVSFISHYEVIFICWGMVGRKRGATKNFRYVFQQILPYKISFSLRYHRLFSYIGVGNLSFYSSEA